MARYSEPFKAPELPTTLWLTLQYMLQQLRPGNLCVESRRARGRDEKDVGGKRVCGTKT